MKTLSEAFIKNDDSAGGTFHLMKKISELEKMAALTGKILTGKEADSQETTKQTRRKCDMENFKEEVAQQKDDLATYEGRAWEELSDNELCKIADGGNMYHDSYPTRCSRKAMAVLNGRIEERHASLMKPIADDGSVRGLIASGDYIRTKEYIKAGEYVMIQQYIDGEAAWFTRYDKQMVISTEKWSTKNYYCVGHIEHNNTFDECEKLAADVVTLCRRKFKKEDIIVCILDSSYEPERGIVFTENKICSFDSKKLEYIISYAEMEDIDFDEDSVTINVSSGEEVTLYCGDEEEYSKGVFNLLMDIKDRLAQA